MARTLRPISRWISCVRPPTCARSRLVLVFVARGSIAYSAVSQPSPRPRRHPGTPSSTDAVHSTRVLPNDTRHDPSAYGATARSSVTGRSASADRPTRTGSAGGGATKGPDDVGGGLARRERNDDHVASPAAHVGGADDRPLMIIAALHEHVGTQQANELEGGILLEQHDAVHHLESAKHISALDLSPHGTLGALEPAHRRVAVQANDQLVASTARTEEHVDMAGMEQIEHAVGEHDAARALLAPPSRAIPVTPLAGGVARRATAGQKMPSA